MGLVVQTIDAVLWVLYVAIFASVIISWLRNFGTRVPHYHPVIRIIEDVAELVLRPIRRYMPVTGGGWDFSPMVALVLLYLVQRILHQALLRGSF